MFKAQSLQAAMADLIHDPRFQTFCDALKELREQAVAFAVTHDSVKDQRATIAALGEVRAYDDILAVVKNAEEGGLAQEEQT